MPCLIWSPSALVDVQRLYRFLLPKSPDAARRAAKAIREGASIPQQQPGLGRPADLLDAAFRDWLIDFGDGGYVVRYRVDRDAVVVLAVRHQREVGFP